MFLQTMLVVCALAVFSSSFRPANGQSVPVTPRLKKLGYDIDPRSLSRILADEVLANKNRATRRALCTRCGETAGTRSGSR